MYRKALSISIPILSLCVIALQSFLNAFAAEEIQFFLLAGTLGQKDFLSEVRGPAMATEYTIRPGNIARWETYLTGDIAGKQYRVSFILKGEMKVGIEVLVVPNANIPNDELLVAATAVEVNDQKFRRFEATFDGIDPKTKVGDKLILHIRHLGERGIGILRFGSQIDDSHIIIPPITSPKVVPQTGPWRGLNNQGQDISFTILKVGEQYLVDNFKATVFVHCESLRDGFKAGAKEVSHVEPNVIKLDQGNSFKIINANPLFIRGTFIDEKSIVGVWSLSAVDNNNFCSEIGTWKVESLSVNPREKLTTTWGKIKAGS